MAKNIRPVIIPGRAANLNIAAGLWYIREFCLSGGETDKWLISKKPFPSEAEVAKMIEEAGLPKQGNFVPKTLFVGVGSGIHQHTTEGRTALDMACEQLKKLENFKDGGVYDFLQPLIERQNDTGFFKKGHRLPWVMRVGYAVGENDVVMLEQSMPLIKFLVYEHYKLYDPNLAQERIAQSAYLSKEIAPRFKYVVDEEHKWEDVVLSVNWLLEMAAGMKNAEGTGPLYSIEEVEDIVRYWHDLSEKAQTALGSAIEALYKRIDKLNDAELEQAIADAGGDKVGEKERKQIEMRVLQEVQSTLFNIVTFEMADGVTVNVVPYLAKGGVFDSMAAVAYLTSEQMFPFIHMVISYDNLTGGCAFLANTRFKQAYFDATRLCELLNKRDKVEPGNEPIWVTWRMGKHLVTGCRIRSFEEMPSTKLRFMDDNRQDVLGVFEAYVYNHSGAWSAPKAKAADATK